MVKNVEIGHGILADTCIVLKNGTRYYVDNSTDNIKEQMDSERELIEIEVTKLISNKISRISIKKEQIEEYYSIKN